MVFCRLSATAKSVHKTDTNDLPFGTTGAGLSPKPAEIVADDQLSNDEMQNASDRREFEAQSNNICQPSTADRGNFIRRRDSKSRESLPKTKPPLDSGSRSEKTINEDIKLLPPAAFLLKKDGSPILEGSAVLPAVFRTDSELEEGQATFKDNHYVSTSVPGKVAASLLVPDDFKPVPTGEKSHKQQKTNYDTHQFVSPAEEIVYIRNVLQDFKQLKHKHR